MEIRDDLNNRVPDYHERNIQGRNMDEKKKDNAPVDRVEISGKSVSGNNSETDIRQGKVDHARANISSGYYDDPEVIDSIVKRLMEQFGI